MGRLGKTLSFFFRGQKLKKTDNMDDDFIKKRLATAMAELKKLCEEHFKQRELEERIANFKKEREVNKENRIKREQEKNARLEELKQKALAEEAERQAKAEARKAEILAAMAGGYDKQAAMDKRRALRPGKKNKKDKKTTMAAMGADGQSTTVQA